MGGAFWLGLFTYQCSENPTTIVESRFVLTPKRKKVARTIIPSEYGHTSRELAAGVNLAENDFGILDTIIRRAIIRALAYNV